MIVILDYGAGNLTSVSLAFRRIGAEAVVTSEPEVAAKADSLVFPGVGSASSGMAGLRRFGLDKVLVEAAAAGKPVLAVCLGMQMMLTRSAEDGGVDGLNIIRGRVERFSFPRESRIKVPHMGWNGVLHDGKHPLFSGIPSGEAFYFVHSFYAAPDDPAESLGTTEYGGFSFSSVVGGKSVFATQFHPERSGDAGLQLLENFSGWDGSSCC